MSKQPIFFVFFNCKSISPLLYIHVLYLLLAAASFFFFLEQCEKLKYLQLKCQVTHFNSINSSGCCRKSSDSQGWWCAEGPTPASYTIRLPFGSLKSRLQTRLLICSFNASRAFFCTKNYFWKPDRLFLALNMTFSAREKFLHQIKTYVLRVRLGELLIFMWFTLHIIHSYKKTQVR